MMPTVPFLVGDAVVSAIPSVSLSLPIGIELAALIPLGFAAGLFALLLAATRATRSAEHRTQAKAHFMPGAPPRNLRGVPPPRCPGEAAFDRAIGGRFSSRALPITSQARPSWWARRRNSSWVVSR